MADSKISALSAVASVDGADEVAVNDAGTSKKASATQISTFVNANITLGAALAVNGNQITSVSSGDIELHSDNDINFILGDAGGADDFNIKDSAGAVIASINSDGALTAVSYGGIVEANLVDKSTTETISGVWTHSDHIDFADAKGIRDDSTNEQLIFQKTASAVNYLEITNAATGNNVKFNPVGSDTDIGLTVAPKADGHFRVEGHMELVHTADANNEHGLEIDIDAAGFGDVKGIDMVYTTGNVSAGEDEECILINIDESAASGGAVVGLEILSTTGSATVYGMECGAVVNPLLHFSGTFGDMDYVRYTTNNGGEVDGLAAFTSTGTDVTLFTADDDYVIIGDAATFEEIEFLLATVASGAGIKPTYQFSTGGSGFTTFSPTDGTNGMRNTGIVAWLLGDISGTWATNASGNYEIKIIRTANALTTAPIEDLVQIASVVEYKWDLNADLTVGSIDIDASNAYKVAGTAILSDSAGTMTLSNIDALDATTETTVEAAIDTLANLTSIQSLTVTLADAGADAILGWDDTASAYENLTQAEVLAVIGDASATAKGVAELATAAETSTGTDTGRPIPVVALPIQIQDSKYTFAADAGSDDTYVISLTPAPAGYVTGQVFHFTANTVNTGAATLNVNSLGAKAILKRNDVVLANGDIEAGAVVSVIYDGTSFQMTSQLGNAPGGTTPILSKSLSIENPTSSEDASMFFTNLAITVTEIRAVLIGSSTPSVTWTVRHGTDRSATGAEVVTSGTATTSVSTGSDVTSFNDATIIADSFVWLETTAQSGTVGEIHVTIVYTED